MEDGRIWILLCCDVALARSGFKKKVAVVFNQMGQALPQFHKSAVFKLPYPLLGDAKLASQLLEGRTILTEPPLIDDRALAGAKLLQCLGKPTRPGAGIPHTGDHVLRIRTVILQELLPFVFAGLGNRSIEGLVMA